MSRDQEDEEVAWELDLVNRLPGRGEERFGEIKTQNLSYREGNSNLYTLRSTGVPFNGNSPHIKMSVSQ